VRWTGACRLGGHISVLLGDETANSDALALSASNIGLQCIETIDARGGER